MTKIVFTYVAVKPLIAEHPVGSGQIVEYAPGDPIPAGEWGRAADNLVELGKAVRLAVNVDDDAEAKGADPVSAPEAALHVTGDSEPESEYPVLGGAGWYTLSDGSRVRGKDAAYKAEAALKS